MMNRNRVARLALLLALVIGLLTAVAAVGAQEATAVPAEGETHSEATPAAEGESHSEAAAPEGEAAASTSPLTPLGINAGFLIAQIINFTVIFLVLRQVLWKRMVDMLDSRGQKIQKGLEDAAVAANARKNAEAEAERIVAAAKADISKQIEEGRARGEDVRKQVEAEARTEAERIRNEARTAAAAERDQQLAALRGQVAAISIAAAQRLIGANLDEKRQQALLNDFFAKVPADAKGLSGQVEVVSAMPLSAEEQAKVKSEIGAEASFSVDPSILGGLIVRSGDRVVDGSVRSNLNDLATRMGS
ncbi:MAG TPA: F0F1 ATP synthase subunit B [Aggregatilineales bacterium]|nr:F0F1 ATP synthase subunit B [Anaerolineae bacterium]HUN07446.1 F0F1 ATP synthase subunit B [Aggregatilineales bacterium]